ncbi:hypothetical protein MMC34_000127 [Xylographa carneopallida]|nr:hypothetical protein [Xylographa carneopallida]
MHRAHVPRVKGSVLPWSPPPDHDERAQRAHRREIKKFMEPSSFISSKRLKEGWENYVQLRHELAELQNTNGDFEVLKSAIARFPRLSMIRVQGRYNYREPDFVPISAPYDKCFVIPEEPDMDDGLSGVVPLEKLLFCASAAGIELQDIWAGPISWKFFDNDRNCLAQTVGTRRHLHELRMELSFLDYDDPEDELTMQMRDRIQLLSNGCVRDFLTASPDLEFIELLFQGLVAADLYNRPNLANIFDGHTWSRLAWLDLRGVETKERYLVDFFQRHAETLKHLTMEDFCLTDSTSSWVSVFEQMPEMLDLISADLRGRFSIVGSNRWICMDFKGPGGIPLGEKICPWLLVNGPQTCRSKRTPMLERRKAIERLLSEDNS